jgi:toxin ParE1/3/4
MAFAVVLTDDAERDLEDIYRHIAMHDSGVNAERVLRGLERTVASLAKLPMWGNVPKELDRIGVREFREAHFKPFRLIYRVEKRKVVVHCILDGRRDMQSLLQRRLLR